MEAVVRFGDHFALYHLSSEQEGVYHAELVRYYGNDETAPPKEILLVKGVRKWIGHPGMPELLEDLGQAVESNLNDSEKTPPRFRGEPTNPDHL